MGSLHSLPARKRTTLAQRRAILLTWAYLNHHAAPEYRASAWLYLLKWATLGGRTSEVPAQFGGTA